MGLLGNGNLPGKGNSGKKCDYCGTKMTPSDATKGSHIGKSPIMGHNRYFCSSRCMRNWKDEHQNSNSQSSSNSENDAELKRLNWEKEQVEKREAEEKNDRNNAKAAELKEENKPYSAFLVQHGEKVGGASGVIALILFFVIMIGENTLLMVVGILLAASLLVAWGLVGFKFLKEYFR